ncbi:hypothetical protein BSKO_07596 [Bryopsis sp. KO-2023]|nr:hypothetical protein BSKO_07596 [Bryopsis sp. KO-2023]
MEEKLQAVLVARRATDLVTSRKDQPTTWRRLTRGFAELCDEKSAGAGGDKAEISRLSGELLSEAWKLDFQVRKWKFGLAKLKVAEEEMAERKKKRQRAEEEDLEVELEIATKDLESGRAKRRAYDRRVALQKACDLEGNLEELEKAVELEKKMVGHLERERVALDASLREAEKKRKAVMLCADEVRWGCMK